MKESPMTGIQCFLAERGLNKKYCLNLLEYGQFCAKSTGPVCHDLFGKMLIFALPVLQVYLRASPRRQPN